VEEVGGAWWPKYPQLLLLEVLLSISVASLELGIVLFSLVLNYWCENLTLVVLWLVVI
jgi:hypothetical protein